MNQAAKRAVAAGAVHSDESDDEDDWSSDSDSDSDSEGK